MPDMFRYLMVPIIGAIIGYATNWIAVKMLFHPHYEVRVFGIKLPFTPGVIPKGQARLAKAVGRAVEEQLLNEQVLKTVLLSQDMKAKVAGAVDDWLSRKEESDATLLSEAGKMITEEKVKELAGTIGNHITDIVYNKVREANPGKIVAEKVNESIKEKLDDSMFGMLLGNSLYDYLAEKVESKVNEYVEEHGYEFIHTVTVDEIGKLETMTIGQTVSLIKKNDIDLTGLVLTIYEELVMNKLPDALKALQLSEIVEDRINAMKVEEVEDLLLSIMKKELGAIVNLGALIGFVLGLINIVILLI